MDVRTRACKFCWEDFPFRRVIVLNTMSSCLQRLLHVSLRACEILQPLISNLYSAQTNGEISAQFKADNSILTLTDAIVQNLLLDILFQNKFRNKVGEEYESSVNILHRRFIIKCVF